MSANQVEDHGLLRFLTCGSVDDGKSTLIGRLLVDSKAVLHPVNGIVYRETWHALQAQCTDPCGCEKEE